MYYQKLTKQEKSSKRRRLNFLINKFSLDVKKWEPYTKLPFIERENCRVLWDDYYLKVHKTEIYEIVRAQMEALHNGEFGLIKELSQRTKEISESGQMLLILKPKVPNPYLYDNNSNIKAYYFFKKELSDLNFDEGSNEVFG